MKYQDFKGTILRGLFLDRQVDDFYRAFQQKYPTFTREHHWEAVKYIMNLNKAQYHYQPLESVALPKSILEANQKNGDNVWENVPYYLKDCDAVKRRDIHTFVNELKEYDVISFDIFDTALYRKVEFPNDVFTIMAIETGHNDFVGIRKEAEKQARIEHYKKSGSKEIKLHDIYTILKRDYDIDEKWEAREIELEYDLCTANPYILAVYNALKADSKTLVFMSDMYLPKAALEKMLAKIGYTGYQKLYLSNEYGTRKGEGTLQPELIHDFPGKKIIHIGDTEFGDVQKSIEAGIDAIYNPDSRLVFREENMDDLGGSFYRAVIQNEINSGMWNQNSIYYDHGFRVGGILTAGYCEYINRIAAGNHTDKILFCARDCEIIWKAYNQFYKKFDNEYINISRYSIMNAAGERYLYDLINRTVLRYADQVRGTKTFETILQDTGFGYLADYLDDNDIERYSFPNSLRDYRQKLRKFLLAHKEIIAAHNKDSEKAAKKYYAQIIGSAKNILIVDIGWSGTCSTALKYFLNTRFPDKNLSVKGMLLCTSRNRALTASVSSGELDAYVYSPLKNMDLTRFMMPANTPVQEQDLLHMPLEFLFTSAERSLVRYKLDEKGQVAFERTGYTSDNKNEIADMQKGILDFIKKLKEYSHPYSGYFMISPYVAFNPLRESIRHKDYCYDVYKNFTYDAFTAPFETSIKHFGDLFDLPEAISKTVVERQNIRGTILFVTPELIFTGAPRSLLRMCKVAKTLGYRPVVWSARQGPFITEYNENDIEVRIVPEEQLGSKEILQELKTFDMAVCNTIVTDKYAQLCSQYLPTVWYIREATNIPDFCRNNPERLFILKHSKSLCCVSDYAAKAIGQYTDNPIRVVHNSVEDEKDMAVDYQPGQGDKVKFVQFGTIEYRKGYDVLAAAYMDMPKEYQNKSELYFAGGFIGSGAPYCSYLFNKIKNQPGIHYLGLVKGEKKKIETLSSMDVIVVASRDESCSLVALEGAMLSKPLIVTQNVGAKYMVNGENGKIVETADVESLKRALMDLIDQKENLAAMGKISRKLYEEKAGMKAYTQALENMYSLCEKKNSPEMQQIMKEARNLAKPGACKRAEKAEQIREYKSIKGSVIVSLTSHPGRIDTVNQTVESLLKQTYQPEKILLWLSKEQFEKDACTLPKSLLKLERNKRFEIRWVEEDMGPHKKYLYTMQEFPDVPVIIVDDDVIYENRMVEKLMKSYNRFPDCVSAMRTNLIQMNGAGNLRAYDNWHMDYKYLLDTPSWALLPTGVGGVLYPPHSLPEIAFDKDAIRKTCLYCDDLWLKIMCMTKDLRAVRPHDMSEYQEIPETQEVALWHRNIDGSNNDLAMKKILDFYDENIGNSDNLLVKIWKDRFC